MWTTDDNHGAQVQFHSGRHMLDPRVPTIGAWVNYGLGSLNDNLPQFISMGPRFFDRQDGHYLGPAYDAVAAQGRSRESARLCQTTGRYHGRGAADARLRAGQSAQPSQRDDSYPDDQAARGADQILRTRFRMQTAVPDVIDFDGETEATQRLYGLDQDETRPFGRTTAGGAALCRTGGAFHPDPCTATGRPAPGISTLGSKQSTPNWRARSTGRSLGC